MIGCLFSGGKDSTLALHRVFESGKRVELLITMISDNDYSFMFHKPNITLSSLQAEALGIRQIVAKTAGEKERELDDLETVIKGSRIDALVTGATASTYQRSRIEGICARLGISHIAPLWHIDPIEELNEIADHFDAVITHVSAQGFDETYLGKRIDKQMISRLVKLHKRNKINLTFEGGEAESFVLDAPLFRKRIVIGKARREWKRDSGTYVIEEARLEEKKE